MKTVLVTGGSRGIGLAISKQCLQQGYAIIVLSKTRQSIERACVELAPYGSVSGQVLDVANRQDIADFCQSFSQPLYGLINNAGVCKTSQLLDPQTHDSDDSWESILFTNLFGPYYLTQGLIQWIEHGGRIVNVASQLGKDGRRGYGAYCASKFGLIGLTKCWAKELGRVGITVNAICPGWVNTDMSQIDAARIAKDKGLALEDYYQTITHPLELGRMSEPEEVASLATFLLSEAASGISGRDWLMHTIWNQE